MLNKLKNLIKWGRITRVGDDNKQFPRVQVTSLGVSSDDHAIFPYGIYGKVPEDTLALKLNIRGSESNSASMPITGPERPRDLKKNDWAIGNFEKGNLIIFRENGDIEIVGRVFLKGSQGGALKAIARDGDVTSDGATIFATSENESA